jgi:beta-phosphoglucomutase
LALGYIFDLDGVITDTAEYHFRGWERLAKEQNWHFTRQDNEKLRGVPRLESLDIILNINHVTLPLEKRQELATLKNEYYLQFVREVSPRDLLPGVGDLLHEAKANGIRIGLGSASKNARDVLSRLQIIDVFDAIGDGFSVVRGKPAPDLFVWTAGRLDLPVAQCIVFEDAEAGVEAALAAEFSVVGIGPKERLHRAHLVRPNLEGAKISEFQLPLTS